MFDNAPGLCLEAKCDIASPFETDVKNLWLSIILLSKSSSVSCLLVSCL